LTRAGHRPFLSESNVESRPWQLLLRLRMAHRKTLDAVLTIAVAWAVLFGVPFLIPQIAWPLNLEIGFFKTEVGRALLTATRM
jgi:hypothetical protein